MASNRSDWDGDPPLSPAPPADNATASFGHGDGIGNNTSASAGFLADNATDVIVARVTGEFGIDDPPSTSPSPTTLLAPSSPPSFSAVPSAVPSATGAGSGEVPPAEDAAAPAASSPPTSSPTPLSTAPRTPAPTYGALSLGPINLVVLTDVHGWVMGRRDGDGGPPSADLGAVLSFYRRLEETAKAFGWDAYLVMNGDFLHGTYLGADPARFLPGILGRMPFDAVSVGEHELNNVESLATLRQPGGLFDLWGDRLVTTNVRMPDSVQPAQGGDEALPPVPLGSQYTLLRGSQGTILVLGFLYDAASDAVSSSTGTTVDAVEDALGQSWFVSLFTDAGPEFNMILVLARMDAQDDSIRLIHSKLRQFAGEEIYVQFVAGHTHRRAYSWLDERSSSFEAGRYLDTVGFLSFDPRTANSTEHVFIDANEASLAQSLGLDAAFLGDGALANDEGTELSHYIQRTMDHSGANDIVGCSDGRYRIDGAADEADSLERLFLDRVLPAWFVAAGKIADSHHHSHSSKSSNIVNVFVHRRDRSPSSLGRDLLPGTVTVNDVYAIAPTDEGIAKIGHALHGDDLLELLGRSTDGADLDVEFSVAVEGVANASATRSFPYGIQNGTAYTLHTTSQHAERLQGILVEMDVPVLSNSKVATSRQTVRDLWMDFVGRHWSYDGDGCKCLGEEGGCRGDDGFVPPSTGAGAGGGGGGGGGPTSGGGGGAADGGDNWVPPEPGTELNATGGGHSKGHVSHTPPSRSSLHHNSKHAKGGGGTSDAAVLWIMVLGAALFVLAVTRVRRWASARALRSERTTNTPSDLELSQTEEAPADVYGASTGAWTPPAMTSRGLYA